MTQLRGGAKKLNLKVNVSADIPQLRADDRLVRQIVVNLCSNAVKFSHVGGDVTIEAALSELGHISISVEDTGIGIAAENIEKVLEPFSQVRQSANLSYEGTGLGLSLSKRFMELHGGTLAIQSQIDVGTTVSVEFPPGRTIN